MGCLNSTSSNGTSPDPHPYVVQFSLTILVVIFILMTVFGNVMVVMAVTTSRALRAPQNLFLVSLACADILLATLVVPFSLAKELMGCWYFGHVWCEIYLALDVLFCTSSIIHLCAISLDRYWSISQAIEYNLRRTPCRIKCTILIVWVLAALISFPPLILMENDDDEQKCEVIEEEWYIYFSSTVSFFVPCAVMILVYVRIYLIAKKRTRDLPGEKQKKFGNLERKEGEVGEVERGEGREVSGLDVEEELSSSDGNDTVLCSRMKKRGIRTTKVAQVKLGESPLKPEVQHCVRVGRWKQRQRRERRFTFVLAVVMGVFVICWFPFFFTYTVFGPERVPKPLFEMFFWLGYCNSSLNPVIYTIFNNDFRRSFKKILCKTDRRQL